jgi:hypothetical protein
MKKFITKGMELFDQDPDMLLSTPEYMKLIEDMEKEKLKIQSNLREAQAAMNPDQGQPAQGDQPAVDAEGREYSPDQKAAYEAKGREFASEGATPTPPTTASILKSVNE